MSWMSPELHYRKNKIVAFPLGPTKTSIEELYSPIKPTFVLIKNIQKTYVPAVVATLLDIVALKTPVVKEGNTLRL